MLRAKAETDEAGGDDPRVVHDQEIGLDVGRPRLHDRKRPVMAAQLSHPSYACALAGESEEYVRSLIAETAKYGSQIGVDAVAVVQVE